VLTVLHYVFDINIGMSSDAVVQLMSVLRNLPLFAVKNCEF